jgi:hypothetical protein
MIYSALLMYPFVAVIVFIPLYAARTCGAVYMSCVLKVRFKGAFWQSRLKELQVFSKEFLQRL